jgi:hypothetical protein
MIYFSTNGWKLIIQGVGYFDKSSSYPIGIKQMHQEVQFLIDELENLTLTNLFTFMTMKQTPIMKFVLQPIKLPFLKARIKLAFHCVSLTKH